jgi:hypothetical protein
MKYIIIFVLLILLISLISFIKIYYYSTDKFNDIDNNESCYYYETINTTDKPILKNLDLTLVLTMENNLNRFIKNDFIINLAPKTIFQINKGFKKCSKNNNGVNIDITWKDLNHAYITTLEKYKDKYNNILILEDDAELLNSDLNKWKEIDDYLVNPNFYILGIGNGGLLYPSISNFKKNMWSMGRGNVSQAIFYNMKKIKPLINKVKYNKYSKLQWDEYLINIKDNKTYRYPMIVQKFPLTDNSKNWNSSSSPMLKKFWDKSDRIFLETFGLDKDITGWTKTYILWNYWYIISFFIIMIITFIIIRCKN